MTTNSYLSPEEMTNEELYTAYQSAKEDGPVERIDELQLEVAERWEEEHLGPDDVEFLIDGRFTSDGFSMSAYLDPDAPSVEEEVWFTWDEVDERKGNEQSDFTFQLG